MTVDEMFCVACGSFGAMKMLKEKGFKGLNPKTNKYQIIDKNAKYEIIEKDKIYYLMSDKNLRRIAEEKGLII